MQEKSGKNRSQILSVAHRVNEICFLNLTFHRNIQWGGIMVTWWAHETAKP